LHGFIERARIGGRLAGGRRRGFGSRRGAEDRCVGGVGRSGIGRCAGSIVAGVAGCGSCANDGTVIAMAKDMASAMTAAARTVRLDVGIGLLI